MDVVARNHVRQRAGWRCEYCGIHEEQDFVLPFHVEHIRPRKHGGSDDPLNLALACHHCNLHKGPNLSGIDPANDEISTLFHPRHDAWPDHFVIDDGQIVGLTACGRTTVAVLRMNDPDRIELRLTLSS